MDSEITNLAQVKAFDSSDYATSTQGDTADSALQNITGEDLTDLADVDTDKSKTPADGDVLTYDGTDWNAETPSGGGASELSDLSDVGTTTATDKNALMADGDSWESRALVEADISDLGTYSTATGVEDNADVTDAANVNSAGATMNTDTSLSGNSYFLDEDTMSSDSATKVSSQQSIKAYVDSAISSAKQAVLPVGSIVVLGVSTNPNTLYGFGTWARIEGKFVVGVSDSDGDFDLDDTGGAKEVTLTAAQSGLPAHNHTITDPGHSHTIGSDNINGNTQDARRADTPDGTTVPTSSNTTGITINNNSAADASSAHSVLNPYVAKYIWERTA